MFQHSPVFRIGGDEFSVILQNEDYDNREALIAAFFEGAEETCGTKENPWEQIHVAMGVAVYDPEKDAAVIDTVRRADKLMYENKKLHKKG